MDKEWINDSIYQSVTFHFGWIINVNYKKLYKYLLQNYSDHIDNNMTLKEFEKFFLDECENFTDGLFKIVAETSIDYSETLYVLHIAEINVTSTTNIMKHTREYRKYRDEYNEILSSLDQPIVKPYIIPVKNY